MEQVQRACTSIGPRIFRSRLIKCQWKGSLIGHSDCNSDEDRDHLHVTYHHNSWTNIHSRLPSLRFGTGHVYNSCFTNSAGSGLNSRMGAQLFAESNVFENVRLAVVTNLDSCEAGFATERDNVFIGLNTSTRITQLTTFLPTYEYAYVYSSLHRDSADSSFPSTLVWMHRPTFVASSRCLAGQGSSASVYIISAPR
jgi:pectate lyase